mmetsp:Transcript_10080/g.11548  ORF Transcript_10080/g.11548 Transcript_10080/m.11548 type:complete len:250 (+) Transcript_10080:51-800(+)
MSGDQLRHFAIIGDEAQLKNLLLHGANPCSVDEHGLSSLHYAVWNGHVDCVKILLMNDQGRHDETGILCSSLNLRTTSSYTALHLAVTCENAIECCTAIVNAGADNTMQDFDGRCPLDIAIEHGNERICKILRNAHTKDEVYDFRQKHDTLSVQPRRGNNRKKWGDICVAPGDSDVFKNKYLIHNDALSHHDKMAIPKELDIPEHYILPIAKLNYEASRMFGTLRIRNLKKLFDHSQINVARRHHLTQR